MTDPTTKPLDDQSEGNTGDESAPAQDANETNTEAPDKVEPEQ